VHNRKIKRIIFASIRKWDGRILRPLSTSQIKQIAGRAGRYNMHGDDLPGGLATTLHADDLPILQQALAAPLLPIQRAFISTTRDHRIDVMQALPPRPTTLAIYEVDLFISNMRSIYRPEESNKLDEQCQFIDSAAGELTLADRELFIKMPLGYRDQMNVKVATAFMHMFKNSMRVILLDGIKNTGLLDTLRRVEASMLTAAKRDIQIPYALELLESFHKVLVMYLWLSMRNPSAFCDYQTAVELKERVEKALQWCLINVSQKTAFKNMRRGHSFVPHNKVFHPRRIAPIQAYS
jgi:ATP-dependent RNA helicase SUPV3L1/SUV3